MTDNIKGKFLIATPELRDPNFAEGVVFICEHNDQGAFGLLINRRAQFKSQPTFEGIQSEEWITRQDLFIGGPVHTNHVLILYRAEGVQESEKRIIDNINLASSPTDILELDDKEKNEANVRLFVGCAGWAKDQLEGEIDSGAWLVKPYVEDMIFSSQPRLIWKQNLARFGGLYQILSSMPDGDDLLRN